MSVEPETFENSLNGLASISEEGLLHPELGPQQFTQVLEKLKRAKALAAYLLKLDYSLIGPEQHQSINRHTIDLLGAIQGVRNFSMSAETNWENHRNSQESRFETAWREFQNGIQPTLIKGEAYRKTDSSDAILSLSLKKAEDAVARATELAANLESLAQGSGKKIDETLERLQKAAEEAGVTVHAGVFETEAGRQRGESKKWGIGALCCSIVVVGIILAGFHEKFALPKNASTGAMVAALFPRLALLSIITIALTYCLKNFTACRHNVIVNSHRANALRTFQIFADAADGSTRQAILLQATKAIFDQQPSGFLKGDVDAHQGSQLIEIVKNVSPEKP